MALHVKCWQCGKNLTGEDDWLGKVGECPGCGAELHFSGAANTTEPPPFAPPPAPIAAPRTGEPGSLFVQLSHVFGIACCIVLALIVVSAVATNCPREETALWLILATLVGIAALLWTILDELQAAREDRRRK